MRGDVQLADLCRQSDRALLLREGFSRRNTGSLTEERWERGSVVLEYRTRPDDVGYWAAWDHGLVKTRISVDLNLLRATAKLVDEMMEIQRCLAGTAKELRDLR